MNNKVIIKFSFYTYKIKFTGRIMVIALHDPFFTLAILFCCVDTMMFCNHSLIYPVFMSNCTNFTFTETHSFLKKQMNRQLSIC